MRFYILFIINRLYARQSPLITRRSQVQILAPLPKNTRGIAEMRFPFFLSGIGPFHFHRYFHHAPPFQSANLASVAMFPSHSWDILVCVGRYVCRGIAHWKPGGNVPPLRSYSVSFVPKMYRPSSSRQLRFDRRSITLTPIVSPPSACVISVPSAPPHS